MNDNDEVQTVYQSRLELLGVESADFLLENGTFIRVQAIARGAKKVVPTDLVESIAKLIREYELSKQNQSKV